MTYYFLETGDNASTNANNSVTLDGITYNLNSRYNQKDESWVISLGLLGTDPMFSVKACCNRVFNTQYKHLPSSPQGDLVIVDIAGSYGRVDFEDYSIEGRYRLLYNDLK